MNVLKNFYKLPGKDNTKSCQKIILTGKHLKDLQLNESDAGEAFMVADEYGYRIPGRVFHNRIK